MKKFTYWLFRFNIFLFSLIPFRVLYALSNFLYYVFYYLVKYRRAVIEDNLLKTFPKKSPQEIEQLIKDTYRNLCDILLEGIKGMSMNEAQLTKHYKFLNPEILYPYYDKGINVIAAASHYCNWEWGVMSAQNVSKHDAYGVYKPLKNPYIDSYVKQSRAILGMRLVPMNETKQVIAKTHKNPSIFFLVTDQNPSNTEKAHWVNFFNRDTACLHGLGDFSQQTNYPIVNFEVIRIRRGYYEVTISVLHDNPSEASPQQLTQIYMSKLEETILLKPGNWLWSHRRWKHSREG